MKRLRDWAEFNLESMSLSCLMSYLTVLVAIEISCLCVELFLCCLSTDCSNSLLERAHIFTKIILT